MARARRTREGARYPGKEWASSGLLTSSETAYVFRDCPRDLGWVGYASPPLSSSSGAGAALDQLFAAKGTTLSAAWSWLTRTSNIRQLTLDMRKSLLISNTSP